MALTSIEQVRLGIGDHILPYIFTDAQVQHYLTSNSDDIDDTVEEMKPLMLNALASQGYSMRAEDLAEDTTKRAQNYILALNESKKFSSSLAYPLIGGSSSTSDSLSVGVDMFDDENNYETYDSNNIE